MGYRRFVGLVAMVTCGTIGCGGSQAAPEDSSSKESEIELVDGQKLPVGEVAVTELEPAGTAGFFLVLAQPIVIQPPIEAKVSLPDGECTAQLTHVTVIGDGRGIEYQLEPGDCTLAPGETYSTATYSLRVTAPDRVRPRD
jgi:hypothetical protein